MVMRSQLGKALLVSIGALTGASLAGVGLAHYAQGDAFSFYKQRPFAEPQYSTPEEARSDWAYPARAPEINPPPAYADQAPVEPQRHGGAALLPAGDDAAYPSYDDYSSPNEPVSDAVADGGEEPFIGAPQSPAEAADTEIVEGFAGPPQERPTVGNVRDANGEPRTLDLPAGSSVDAPPGTPVASLP